MTIRRFPQLAHWGAYTAVVEDGRLIRCEPHAADSDPSPMLDSIIPLVYSDKRIRKPAVRRSWLQKREHSNRALRARRILSRLIGTWRWIWWRKRIAGCATNMARRGFLLAPTAGRRRAFAPRSLAGAALLLYRRRRGGSGGNYSWGTAQFFLPYIIGTFTPLTGRVTTWPSVVDNAEILLAFGGLALKNAQVASGGAVAHTLKPALEQLAKKGTPIVNISPMRDDCPEFANAEWIPIRPNTDAALMMALAFEIQRVGAQDDAFLASHCVGYPQLAAYLQGKTDGVEKTPEWASQITGIPAARIARLAQQLIGVRSFITCAYSVQRAHRGEQPYWMMIALSAMLGQVGLPGGGFSFGHGSMNGVGNPRFDTPGARR
ncbi:Dimethyl sulfoxide/trimethylamine N-oxide reductase precursor [Ewingella americana]|uniref:Dimethyl sulfoxide/trimethylamine N-oxide reductase n=1 Tax=Ewingella americana TaxID=41202 RepID=A0A377N8U7_9GAMM|nr:Dimethyl sulfoxide/trimethylamine N-oxide reductase precursor [Ewingella americana]